ncbi:MAG: zinc chelation protein SecC [Epsilonproteobacteria bacterium]|nr:zinc chelation protein SecC [Campylobacterota bacterium]
MNYKNTNISTPKELMRSRYDAFTRCDWDYLEYSSTTQKADDFHGMESTKWLKLEILNAKDDMVEFKAYYQDNKIVSVLHEKSYFIKVDGRWKYSHGQYFDTKMQRNELCPCGSGKKFKKCCL